MKDRAAPAQLPTGRHGFSREFVVENQRGRLLTASVEVLGERGYSRATTQAIADRARVSKRTLYEQFTDVWDCLSAAYAVASDELCGEISEACADDGDGDWPERLSRGVETALAWAVARPDFARLLSGEPPAAVESLRAARRELTERLAALLRTGRSPDTALPEGLEERLIDAALSLVTVRLMAGRADTLPELGPELTEILLQPYRRTSRG